MTLAKKSANPPSGFKLAYARPRGESEWVAFGTQPRAPAYLERCAGIDPDVWMQYGAPGGEDVIYVRAR